MSNLVSGLRDYWRAQRLLFRRGLWPLFLVPGAISVLYFPACIILSVLTMTDVAGYVHDHWVPGFLQSGIMRWILTVFLWFGGIYVGLLLFRNVVMILYSPVLSFLSEAAEDKAAGEERPGFSWKEAVHSAVRGTTMSILTLLLALAGLILSWLVALLPVVGGLLALGLMPVTQFFLAGLGFCDPPLERRGVSIAGTVRHAWNHRGRVIGHGVGFTLLLLVPLAGWFLAPCYGIVAGTLGVVEVERGTAPSIPEAGGEEECHQDSRSGAG